MLVLAALPAGAQGRPQKQVVLSEAVVKSIAVSKPKSKTPLGAQVGLVRRSNVAATKESVAAPASVREISPGRK